MADLAAAMHSKTLSRHGGGRYSHHLLLGRSYETSALLVLGSDRSLSSNFCLMHLPLKNLLHSLHPLNLFLFLLILYQASLVLILQITTSLQSVSLHRASHKINHSKNQSFKKMAHKTTSLKITKSLKAASLKTSSCRIVSLYTASLK